MKFLLGLTSGYKTYVAGLSAILTGTAQMLDVAPAAVAQTSPHGLALIIIGVGLLGLGHKADKLLEVLKSVNTAPVNGGGKPNA